MSAVAVGIALAVGPLADLRVGQDAATARVEIVCVEACAGRLHDGALVISGLTADLTPPPGERSLADGPLRSLRLTAERGGTRLTWAATVPTEAALAPCGARVVCLDITFGPAPLRRRLAEASGDPLSPEECAEVPARLAADAWDLDSFRREALCRAAAGRIDEAAGMLDRLLRVADDPAARRARKVLAARLADASAGG